MTKHKGCVRCLTRKAASHIASFHELPWERWLARQQKWRKAQNTRYFIVSLPHNLRKELQE